jgi:hypothetical protein
MERDAEVLRDALALSPEVRVAPIDSLIGSLDQVVDAAAEEAWLAGGDPSASSADRPWSPPCRFGRSRRRR